MTAFLSLLDESDGEITQDASQAIEKWFEEIGSAVDAKLDGYCQVVRELLLRSDARHEEAERLKRRADVDANAVRSLKDRLKLFMELQGKRSIETARYKITVAANGGRPPLDIDAAALWPSFLVIRTEPDTAKIHAALAAGEQVTGVRVKERGNHLRIT